MSGTADGGAGRDADRRAPGTRRRRELTAVVVACAAAALVALFAAARPWVVELVARPAPLPPLRTERSGAALAPALPALALVALSTAGGLLATRRAARRLVAALMCASGVGVAWVAVAATAGSAPGYGVVAGVCVVAGVVVAAAGVVAVVRGPGWPEMGARYESVRAPAPVGPDASEGELWDALDRGTDPTKA
jgi:hypothetical protein